MNFFRYVAEAGYPKSLLDEVIIHVHKYTYIFYAKGKVQVAPKWELKIIQKIVKKYLYEFYAPDGISGHATAYIKGKNISYNVDRHQGNNYFFTTDFENFFPSIHLDSVQMTLEKILYKETPESLDYIIKIAFYNKTLQYGFPTSPIISNLIMQQFDNEFQKKLDSMFDKEKPKYSRYSDDITVSSKYKIQKNEILDEIKQLISSSYKYLNINHRKTKIFEKYAKKPHITGLVPLTNRNTIGKNKYNSVKLNIFLLLKNTDVENTNFYQSKISMTSYLSYLYNVDRHNYNRLKAYFCSRYDVDLINKFFIK